MYGGGPLGFLFKGTTRDLNGLFLSYLIDPLVPLRGSLGSEEQFHTCVARISQVAL